jgi:TonB family protein
METVTEAVTERPAGMEDDLHFLTDWEVLQDHTRTRRARIASVLVHVGLVVLLFSLPNSVTAPVKEAITRQITPLIEPLTSLTQTAPNRNKVNQEFNVESAPARPRVHIPATPPPAPRTVPAAPLRKLAPPPAHKAAPTPAPALPDAPKVDAAQQVPQVNMPQVAQAAPPPPPQIQQQEKPKLAFETPAPATAGPGTGKLARPDASVQGAIASMTHGGASGGLVVGDPGAISPGISGGLNLPPMPGKPGASLELLSNPSGVDFRPYLIQVLAAVKLNWFNVWPQSARMGRQGRVAIQFAIDRKGLVPKLVIASGSGTDALDKAAVAGISASQPLPQFPTGFTGDQVRLQLNFVYNMR